MTATIPMALKKTQKYKYTIIDPWNVILAVKLLGFSLLFFDAALSVLPYVCLIC